MLFIDWVSVNYWFGGIVAFLLTLYKIYEWWEKRKNKSSVNTLRNFAIDTHDIEVLLAKIINDNVVFKATIIRSHNGGGKPTLGKPYYIDTITSTKKEDLTVYSDIKVDGYYLKIISNLLNNDYYDVHFISVDNSFLKRSWASDGIVFARFYPILLTKYDFYFFKVSFIELPSEERLFECDLYFNKIKNIYLKHHKNNK